MGLAETAFPICKRPLRRSYRFPWPPGPWPLAPLAPWPLAPLAPFGRFAVRRYNLHPIAKTVKQAIIHAMRCINSTLIIASHSCLWVRQLRYSYERKASNSNGREGRSASERRVRGKRPATETRATRHRPGFHQEPEKTREGRCTLPSPIGSQWAQRSYRVPRKRTSDRL